MSTLAAEGPNAEQIRYWNEDAAPKWIALQERIDAQLAVLGERAMERAGLAPGERVLDVGCGCGTTTIALARRVGPGGSALGVDLSAAMLDVARGRAGDSGARFEQADAQTHPFAPGSLDVVFSRFGVMFFADPRAAFANLGTALGAGGRLAFVCWQALERNPWFAVPLAAVLRHVPPPPPAPPDAPGPFAFADAGRVRALLEDAGFVAVEVAPVEEQITVGATVDLDEAVALTLQVGPAGRVLREAGEAARAAAAPTVREALAPYHTAAGVRLGAAAWVVTARRP